MTPAEVIAQALARHPWNSYPHAAHGEHNYDSACGVCRGDVEALANVALYALAGAGMVVVSADDYLHLLDRTEQFAMHRFDADDSVLVARLRAALPERKDNA